MVSTEFLLSDQILRLMRQGGADASGRSKKVSTQPDTLHVSPSGPPMGVCGHSEWSPDGIPQLGSPQSANRSSEWYSEFGAPPLIVAMCPPLPGGAVSALLPC